MKNESRIMNHESRVIPVKTGIQTKNKKNFCLLLFSGSRIKCEMTRVLVGVVVIVFATLLTPAAVNAACDNDKVCEAGEAFLSCSDCGLVPECGTGYYKLGKTAAGGGAGPPAPCPAVAGVSDCSIIKISDYSDTHPCIVQGCKVVGTDQRGDCNLCNVRQVVINVAHLILSMVGGAAVVLLLWGSFGLILNFGNAERIEGAKKTVLNTVLGLAIVLVAWFLVNTLVVVLTNQPGGQSKNIKLGSQVLSPWYNPKCE